MDMEALRKLVDPELYECMDNIHEMCNAPYAIENEIELISAKKGLVRMKKKVKPQDLNSNGVVHGAASFGLVDHAFAVICNMDVRTVGLSCSIVYHRPCFGKEIEAEAREINRSKSVMTVDVYLYSEGKLIATASCIGFISERPKR